MKFKTVKVHTVTYLVKHYYENEHDDFRLTVDTYGEAAENLSDAINQLEIAKVQKPDCDWVLEVQLDTKVSGNEIK